VMTERVSKNIQMRVLFGSDFFLGLRARSDKRVRGLDEKSGDRPFAVDLSAHSPVFSYRFSFFMYCLFSLLIIAGVEDWSVAEATTKRENMPETLYHML
jgi:hypothetical protein